MTKEMICISCPIGCRLTAVLVESTGDVEVTGNECKRGVIYGTEEVLSPSRMVTATVAVKGLSHTRVPVKSEKPVPRDKIDGLLDALYRLRVEAPVSIGQSILTNYDEAGIDIVATRSIGIPA